MRGKFLKTRRVAIGVIAGFLILLHIVFLADLYTHDKISNHSTYVNLQSLISISIAASLLLVILGKKAGIVGMWVSITALILTQYWAHFGFQEADFTEGRSVFSYLRGFMIPTAITFLFVFPRTDKE